MPHGRGYNDPNGNPQRKQRTVCNRKVLRAAILASNAINCDTE